MAKRFAKHTLTSESKKSKRNQIINEYSGYTLSSNNVSIDTIKATEITPEEFHSKYIIPRKPVIIDGIFDGFPIEKFQFPQIEDNLNSNDKLLVEEIDNGGFGSAQERIKLTFKEFIKKLKEEGNRYYLTTQYLEDDPDVINLQDDGYEEIEDDDDDQEKGDWANEGDDDTDEGFTPPGSPIDSKNEGEIEEEIESSTATQENFSDTDSIDFNNLHDDFDDLDDDDGDNGLVETEEIPDDELVTRELSTGPLSIFEAKQRIKELIQKPLTEFFLDNELPLIPNLFSKLITQQINIWVGSTKSAKGSSSPSLDLKKFKVDSTQNDLGLGRKMIGGGISSGLHHDHADNLYVPLKGYKRFTIFSPRDAEKLYTVGDLDKIYKSGVINYTNNDNAPFWKQLRSDSAIISETYNWKLETENDHDIKEKERSQMEDFIDNEANLINTHEEKYQGIKFEPPSFSKIPVALLHLDQIPEEQASLKDSLNLAIKNNFPKLLEAKFTTVNLKPGQMFYLPSGWFHEVTSFGSDGSEVKDANEPIHMALNYWFAPPSTESDDKVYKDNYWTDDFARTRASTNFFRENKDLYN
ncbi:hypothetical protein WICMUC_000917 [Wickerhamomyces mucosus]|uniref:JmjC domain-containing protein n=1 Tax=Wickerhamomyces mucosus TaxID=1378264 RepID=A0A9P8PYF7_9ASCO|nr:hypothetical protein WICMUC_000917 [Wickerhamomyces mucosus]